MRQIALQIEVERQIGDVWGLLADHERMAEWIWTELKPKLSGLEEIELQETSNCSVIYRGE